MPRKKTKKSSSASYPAVLRPYWRFEYARIAKESNFGDDPFAGIEHAKDHERLIVVRGARGCLMLNAFPYAAGHLLALPYRAVGELENLTEEENEELMDLVVTGKLLLQKVLKVDGVNIGLNQGEGQVSGGSVPKHLHWHIVPRWKGDNNFIPVIGGTRLLIRSQESVWKELKKAYQKM